MTDPVVVIFSTIAVLSPILVLILFRSVFQPAPLSPVWITVSIISGVGAFGFLLSTFLIGARGGSAIIELTADERVNTVLTYAGTIWLIVLGALGSVFLRGKSTVRAQLRNFDLNPRIQTVALLISLVPLLLIIGTLGQSLLYRDVYLAGERGGSLFGLGQQLGTATAAIAGYVMVAGTKNQRVWAFIIAFAYLATFFGLGSRRLALFPIVIAIGAILARPNNWARFLVPAIVVSAVLLPLPLFLRGSVEHGLFPYLGQLASFDLFAVDWRSSLNNVLISFPITGATIYQAGPIPNEYFWISLNPLPGDIAGFYDIPENLGLNRYTPYSTIGEVWNHGLAYGLGFWVIAGIILSWLDAEVGRWLSSRYAYIGLAIVVLTCLFGLTCLQYNLRSSSRMLVYAALITIAAAIVLRGKRKEPETPSAKRQAALA